jgi:alanine racemase
MSEATTTGRNGSLHQLHGRIPKHATGVVIVDLERLADNWRALQSLVSPAKCAAVVKANAYGLGVAEVAPALAGAGADTFFVATLDEAVEVQELAPGAVVYVLNGVFPGAAAAMIEACAIPVLSSLPEVEEWGTMAPSRQQPLPCALHVDTGLNRLGLSARDIQKLAHNMHLLDRLDVKLVMSHLACADEPGHLKNDQQREIFKGLQPLLPSVPLSLAASDGLMLGPNYHFDVVRPGYALYGGQAVAEHPTPVKPVVEAYARVLQVRELAPGQSIGYSATFVAERVTRVAVIAAGYADGCLRHLSAGNSEQGGQVAFAGKLAPIAGRVSMDLITVDVTELEDTLIERGDWAEIIGPNITIEDVGRASGTIGYEVLTRLSHRFTRIYTRTSDCQQPQD